MATTKYSQSCVFKLNTGAKVPGVGLGTWLSTGQEAYDSVMTALKAGYRHIDTAWIYGNEEEVGKAIRDSGIKREELFITTKLWNTFHRDPATNLDQSLKMLGLDYVDLYLMHWPTAWRSSIGEVSKADDREDKIFPKHDDGSFDFDTSWDFVKTWEQMQKISKEKAKAIGVSNFSTKQIEQLLDSPTTTITPAVNQVELHPYLPQDKLINFCSSKGILVVAYSPFGHDKNSGFEGEQIIKKLREKYSIATTQLLVSWALWRGTPVLPKSSDPSHVIKNFETVQLTDEDGEAIYNLIQTRKRFNNPPWNTGDNLFHDGEKN